MNAAPERVTAATPVRARAPRRPVRGFVVAYAIGAAVWVLLSDRLVEHVFQDPAHLAAINLAKGWLFVAVSAAIFYFTLKRAHARRGDVGADEDEDADTDPAGSRRRRVAILVVATVVILGAGLAGIALTNERRQEQEFRRLQAVAALRAERLADWMVERRREAQTVTEDAHLAEHATQSAVEAERESRHSVLSTMRAHRAGGSYDAVALVDGRARATVVDGHWGDAPDAPLVAAVRRALSSGRPTDTDVYRESARGAPVIDFVAPVGGRGATRALVLRVSAADVLYPLLRAWPFESASAETHVVRRDGDDALSLSPLRFMPDSPLRFRVPLSDSRLPAPRVLAGTEPLDRPLRGPDYRGVETIAWSVPVAGTHWVLVAKVDRAEFLAAARRDAVWIGLAALLALTAVGFAVQMLHEQDTLRLTRGLRRRQDEALRNASLLRNIVDSSTDSIFAKDADGRYVLLNAAAERAVGRGRGEALGHVDTDLFPAATAHEIRADDLRIMAHGEVVTMEESLDTVDGRVALLTTKGPLRDADGAVIGVFGIARDVTERARVAAELDRHRNHLEVLVRQRTEELEVANVELQRRSVEVARLNDELGRRATQAEAASRAKSAFLANMSHEIRTPLNAIVGLTYLVRRSSSDRTQADRLGKIVAAADHLLAVINDILDISKIEAGKLTLASEPIEVHALMDQVGAWAAERAREKPVEFRVEPIAGLPPLVLGDATRLRQLLLNYASNAVKFTERGSIVMRGRVESETADALVVRFEVEDTGPGVSEDVQSRLFHAFEQGDDSTTRRHGGTGLGLAINRLIAREMHGEAGVDSTPGVGSRFWVTVRLGRVAPSAPADGVQAAHAHALPDEDALRRAWLGTRVLLAEDNPINREVAEELLTAIGLATDVAADGAVAVAKARTTAYALVLMDLQMPVMDGFDAIRAIRALPAHRDTPIVAMTASVTSADRNAAEAAGASDFISKPFTPAALHRLLLRWLPAPEGPESAARAASAPAAADAPDGAASPGAVLLQRLSAIAGLEPLHGLPYAGRDPHRYLAFLQRFVASACADSARCRAALSARDAVAARRAIHSTKGSAAFAGAVGLRARAADLEGRIETAASPDVPAASLDAVATALCEFDDELGRLALAVDAVAAETTAAAAPSASATDDAPASATERDALLARLEELLDQGDTAAARLVEHTRTTLRAALGTDLGRLVRHVEEFEYEAARDLVRAARVAHQA